MTRASLTSEQKLDLLQQKSFNYFVHETNTANGLVADKSAQDWPASIAAVGFALSCYPVAVERGMLSRDQAITRTLATLRFFRDSKQSDAADASGYRGFYYHFLDMHSGKRAFDCELSTIDTALLLAGMLTCAEYFSATDAQESEIRQITDFLYRRVEWTWVENSGSTITLGWMPESGFLEYRWTGYNEGLIVYLLALGSPTFPIGADSYDQWLAAYDWRTCYGMEYVHAAPLFVHQFSHLWVDFRGIQDACMRAKGIDYFENSRRATLIQQRYAIENPQGFVGYGEYCWGLTASDGPGDVTISVDGKKREYMDYVARGALDGPDDGTVAPWVAVASLPFAPEIVLPTIDHFIDLLDDVHASRYGFNSAINLTFRASDDSDPGWVSPFHFGINQGPVVLMIENYRTGMLWKLMRNCAPLVAGLRAAKFTGGWLETAAAAGN